MRTCSACGQEVPDSEFGKHVDGHSDSQLKRSENHGRRVGRKRGNLEALKILRDTGAVIPHGHFVLASGLHTAEYVNKDAIYRYPAQLKRLGELLAERFWFKDISVVLGPAVGGSLLSIAVAQELNTYLRFEHSVQSAYADKDGVGFVIRRGYEEAIRGRKVLVVDDVITTGSSISDLLTCVRKYDAEVVGLGVICNRGGVSAEALHVPELQALVGTTLATWTADKCVMCRRGDPINTSLGHGQEFLETKKASS